MKEYLSQKFSINDPQLVSVFDELPLWSAPFGLMLLDKVKFHSDINILDIGCGAGFPLIELSERFGESCKVYGIDPWEEAINRINLKIKTKNIKNVSVIKGFAEALPFENGYFDLIVSNNGINNVEDVEKVLSECFRVSKPNTQMVITVNLPDTMKEFYKTYEDALRELGKNSEIEKMKEHIFQKRKPLSFMKELLNKSGFDVVETAENFFNIRFLNGSAMFNHFFIKLGFLEPWKEILNPADLGIVFNLLEEKLNKVSKEKGELCLTIPMVCIDCRRNK
jgi:ubiquinone/menaquinone biosynthesis C-methylase UbiE